MAQSPKLDSRLFAGGGGALKEEIPSSLGLSGLRGKEISAERHCWARFPR